MYQKLNQQLTFIQVHACMKSSRLGICVWSRLRDETVLRSCNFSNSDILGYIIPHQYHYHYHFHYDYECDYDYQYHCLYPYPYHHHHYRHRHRHHYSSHSHSHSPYLYPYLYYSHSHHYIVIVILVNLILIPNIIFNQGRKGPLLHVLHQY